MKKLIPPIGAITGLLLGMPCLNAGGPELKIERSVKVSFDSEAGKSYNAYSTTDVAKQKWELLGGPVDGTGEKIVFFYQSDDDQKVFFKVEENDQSNTNTGDFGDAIKDQLDKYIKSHKNDFELNLFGTTQVSDLQTIESSANGRVEIEMFSMVDLTIKGDMEIAEDSPGYDVNFKLLGRNISYTIRLVPAVFNSEHKFWYGFYILVITIDGETTLDRGSFWLGPKGE